MCNIVDLKEETDMFIHYTCMDTIGDERDELATFYGIRYNRNGFAVLSTEHNAHDYLLPMRDEEFKKVLIELTDAIKKGSNIVYVTNGYVYRVRRGAMLPFDGNTVGKYVIKTEL